MALDAPKATLLHAVVASLSPELATVDDVIHKPARLPTELLLIIRAHLLSALTNHFFLESTRALATYEEDLQRLLCPDCISYNHEIYGPDVWQWQQFSGPCSCIQTPHDESVKPSTSPQQFANPHHWLEHHLSLQVARLSPTPSPSPSIWDAVAQVLHRHHCELLKEDLDAMLGTHLFPSSIDAFYYRRVVDFYGSMKPQSRCTIRLRPLQSSLRLLENRGIGEAGEAGEVFRTDIILCHASRDLCLSLELKDVFSSPREPPTPAASWASRKATTSDISIHKPAFLPHFRTSLVLHCVVKTYSFLSTSLAVFVSMPITIATLALTIFCFYSRPIALRIGV